MRQLIDWTDVRLLVRGNGPSLHLDLLKQCINTKDPMIIKCASLVSGKMNLSKDAMDILVEFKNLASENGVMNAINK